MASVIPGTTTAASLRRTEQLWKVWDTQAQKEGARRTVYWVHGEKYLGDWVNNKKEGKGTLLYKNGDKYEGDWLAGKKHGLGTLWLYKNGTHIVRYTGRWKHDTPWGAGVFYDDNGNFYEGDWWDGKRHGRGRAVFGGREIDGFGGDVYEGNWENDFRQGHGTLTYANGDIYEGSWKYDQKDGHGTMYFIDRNKRLDGIWVDDVPKSGVYSELAAEHPETPGTLPPLELKFAKRTLDQALHNALDLSLQG